jgi:CRISPR/Cas system-associated exonuclease Cas4 (RecB family)
MNSTKNRKKQGRLFGRAVLIKEEKKKKLKVSSGIPGRVARGISASAIRTYMSCQKLFYYQYVLGMRLPGKPIQFLLGGAFHKGLEAFYNKEDPEKAFLAEYKFEEMRDISDAQKKKGETKKSVFEENKEIGLQMMREWKKQAADIHKTYDIALKGKSEERFQVWWNHPGSKGARLQVPINGIYDRTTVAHQILEFKTSSKPYKQDDIDVRDQASIYIYNYFLQHKVWPKDFYFIVFIKGRKNNPIQVLRTERTKEEAAQMYEKIELILNNLKGRTEKDYKYGEGFMHTYCDCKRFEEQLLL